MRNGSLTDRLRRRVGQRADSDISVRGARADAVGEPIGAKAWRTAFGSISP